MLGRLAPIVVLLSILAGGRAMAEDAPVGTVFHDVMTLVGRQVPLPAGDWTLVGRSFEPDIPVARVPPPTGLAGLW